jgi:hypothetical protein
MYSLKNLIKYGSPLVALMMLAAEPSTFAQSLQQAPVKYSVTLLPHPKSLEFLPQSISKNGNVSGYDVSGNPGNYDPEYLDGVRPELLIRGNMWSATSLNGLSAGATCVSFAGLGVGWSWSAAAKNGVSYLHAVVFRQGKAYDLFTGQRKNSYAFGDDDKGEIGGIWTDMSSTADQTNRTFFFCHGHAKDIGSLGGAGTTGIAMNRSGIIVGEANLPAVDDIGRSGTPVLPIEHPFIWDNGSMTDIDHASRTVSGEGLAVSDNGTVVYSQDLLLASHYPSSLYLWKHNRSTLALRFFNNKKLIGNVYFAPYGVNDDAVIVGNAFVRKEHKSYEFAACCVNGMVYNLNSQIGNSAKWTLKTATAINDRGQIVGVGTFNGHPNAYLLTPIKNH